MRPSLGFPDEYNQQKGWKTYSIVLIATVTSNDKE